MTEQQMIDALGFFHAMGIIATCLIVGGSVWAIVEFCGNLWRAVFGDRNDGMAVTTHTIGKEQQATIIGPDGKTQTVTMREVPMRPCDHLIVSYEKYIAILGEEIAELSVLAETHGRESTTRYEAGLMARMEIESVMKDIGQSDCGGRK